MTSTNGNSNFYKEKKPSGYSKTSIQQFSPEAMALYKQLFSHLGEGSFLSRLAGGDQSMFEEMEAPAMKQFGEMQGQLGSRFSGMGMGARRGSGFSNTMNQATSDFAQQLQSQRMGLQNQATRDLMNMAAMLMGQKPMDKGLVEKSKPWWQELALTAGNEFIKQGTKKLFGGGGDGGGGMEGMAQMAASVAGG